MRNPPPPIVITSPIMDTHMEALPRERALSISPAWYAELDITDSMIAISPEAQTRKQWITEIGKNVAIFVDISLYSYDDATKLRIFSIYGKTDFHFLN